MLDIEKVDHVGIRVRDKAVSLAFHERFELLRLRYAVGQPTRERSVCQRRTYSCAMVANTVSSPALPSSKVVQ